MAQAQSGGQNSGSKYILHINLHSFLNSLSVSLSFIDYYKFELLSDFTLFKCKPFSFFLLQKVVLLAKFWRKLRA